MIRAPIASAQVDLIIRTFYAELPTEATDHRYTALQTYSFMAESNTTASTPLSHLALLYLKLGVTAFGGPAAHIAMMEDEVVRRRGWVSHEEFLDLLGATNLIPGPNSTEMAIHMGYQRAGVRGLLIAGACFIFPAVAITLLIARLYVAYGTTPQFLPIIAGIRPAVIAIILGAIVRLGKPVVRNRFVLALGVFVTILAIIGVDPIILLLASGALGLLWRYRDRISQSSAAIIPALMLVGSQTPGATDQPTIPGLALFFLKIGSILYGSGYVLVAFLQSGLVESRHWLTHRQLLDAITVGQFTPGPVLSTATFIGYVIGGFPGSVAATIGIFLPSFVFVLISNPFIPKIRRSPLASGFLDGVNAAALGLMLAVTVQLAAASLSNPGSWTLFILASTLLIFRTINGAWIVIGSGLLSWLFALLRQLIG